MLVHIRQVLCVAGWAAACLAIAGCGKDAASKPPSGANTPSARAVPDTTPTPAPTPVPVAERLHAFAAPTPPFERLKPVVLFREDECVGMGALVNDSFIVSAVDRFPAPPRKKSVDQIAVMPGGKPVRPPKTPTPEETEKERGDYYYYQEIAPEVSPKYSILEAQPNHAARFDAAILQPGPRYPVRGFHSPSRAQEPLRFSAGREREFVSVLTGKSLTTRLALELEDKPENRTRPTQVVLAVNSSEEPLEIGYPFATPGERLVIINRIETMTDDLRSSLTLAGMTVAEDADRMAVGALLPRYLDYEQKYGILLGSVAEEAVSKQYEPVFIYRNEVFHGSGTLVHDGDSTPTIVSTRHQFAPGDKAFFTYQRLRPLDMETLHPLKSVRGCSDGRLDIVIAEPGDGGMLEGVPEAVLSVDPDEVKDPSFKNWVDKNSKRTYTSLLTGLKYDGYTLLDGQGQPTPYILLLYTVLVGVGESGSGFERDDGKLFTLRGGMELKDAFRLEIEAEGIEIAPEIDHLIFGAIVPDGEW